MFVCSTFAVMQRVARVRQRQLIFVVTEATRELGYKGIGYKGIGVQGNWVQGNWGTRELAYLQT